MTFYSGTWVKKTKEESSTQRQQIILRLKPMAAS